MHSLGVGLSDATKKLETEKVDSPAARAYRLESWAALDDRKDHPESPGRISTLNNFGTECSQLVHHGNPEKMQT